MTFEEFFNKKRIDLAALKTGEPGLFAEFEKHFAQMGAKSFDHTKKYWFNKLRLQYHLAPALKPQKVHIENQLAEQTIIETLTEKIPPTSVGFKPKFKANTGTSDTKNPRAADSATATPELNDAAATHDQNPSFQQEKAAMQDMADATPRTTDDTSEEKVTPSAPKQGFKPRFNLKMTGGGAPQTKDFEKLEEPENKDSKAESTPEVTESKPGFKPRFVAPKPENVKKNGAEPAMTEDKQAETEPAQGEQALEVSKPGFKPRFNMKMAKPQPTEEERESLSGAEQPVEGTALLEQDVPATKQVPSAPKVGFKPRFNAKIIKPKPPEDLKSE
jgi:hypothetical protein